MERHPGDHLACVLVGGFSRQGYIRSRVEPSLIEAAITVHRGRWSLPYSPAHCGLCNFTLSIGTSTRRLLEGPTRPCENGSWLSLLPAETVLIRCTAKRWSNVAVTAIARSRIFRRGIHRIAQQHLYCNFCQLHDTSASGDTARRQSAQRKA
jgi:hypothetical protein